MRATPGHVWLTPNRHDVQRCCHGPWTATCADRTLVIWISQRKTETSVSRGNGDFNTDRRRNWGGHANARLTSVDQTPSSLSRETRAHLSGKETRSSFLVPFGGHARTSSTRPRFRQVSPDGTLPFCLLRSGLICAATQALSLSSVRFACSWLNRASRVRIDLYVYYDNPMQSRTRYVNNVFLRLINVRNPDVKI